MGRPTIHGPSQASLPMASDQADVPEGSAFRAITVMSLTASVWPMAAFPLDLFDMILISILGMAELAAAIGYAGAILHSTSLVGIGMASASGARVAHAPGSGDADPVQRHSCTTLVQGPLLGCAVVLLVGVNLPHLVAAPGVTGPRRVWPWAPCASSSPPFRLCRSAWSTARSCAPW